MKYLFLIAAIAAFCSAAKLCGTCKHLAVQQAIGKFCQNRKLIVPSTYSNSGVRGNDGQGFVQIIGICNPPQWVPQGYCMEQFDNMCANEQTVAHFGKKKCQAWKIHYGPPGGNGQPHQPTPKPAAPKPAKPTKEQTRWNPL